MEYMKPIATTDAPIGEDWIYEVKYDGFRAALQWDTDKLRLISRNGHDMSALFPEIAAFCLDHESKMKELLPVTLDGELVILNHQYQANFSLIQQRGRMKKKERIEQFAKKRPATFLAFDILLQNNSSLKNETLEQRKKALLDVFVKMEIEDNDIRGDKRLAYIPAWKDPSRLWSIISDNKAEGMIAKRNHSTYFPGKKHSDWYKVKNWRQINGFLHFYDGENDYFSVHMYENDEIRSIGKCKHGLSVEEKDTLKTLFTTNGNKVHGGYTLPPAVCIKVNTLDLYKGELREPNFAAILPHHNAVDCTLERLQLDMAMIPSEVEPSHTDKIFWPARALTKGDLLVYIREIAPYMLPFLNEKIVTVIRAPDGVDEQCFFQKHLPDYAPSFIRSVEKEGEVFILCDHLEALVWFANHGTIEYHIPFEKMSNKTPSEIVFDLDPPDAERFPLAIQAALILKELLDDLELISFAKTSGSKGMQIHIPIPDGSMTYEETAILTKAIAETMVNARPNIFTTERLKQNRQERLYIDYVQHAPGKTIIAPYSPRLTDSGSVATPLYWEEVTDELRPDKFTIENVVERVQTIGSPFVNFFETGEKQRLDKVQGLLQG